MSLGSMSYVDFKEWSCRPVEFKHEGPYEYFLSHIKSVFYAEQRARGRIPPDMKLPRKHMDIVSSGLFSSQTCRIDHRMTKPASSTPYSGHKIREFAQGVVSSTVNATESRELCHCLRYTGYKVSCVDDMPFLVYLW